MKYASILTSAILLCGLPANALLQQGYTGKGLQPAALRCEYRVQPLGIDETKPRLSWIVESGARGQRQTAYRVIVATTVAALAKEQGDLWDRGRVSRSETGHPSSMLENR